jgi:hypothetical protein
VSGEAEFEGLVWIDGSAVIWRYLGLEKMYMGWNKDSGIGL